MANVSTFPAGPLNLDGSGNLNVNVAAGGGSGGTSSNIGSAYPGTATAAGAKDTSNNMAALNLNSGGALRVQLEPGASGTTTNSKLISAASTNATSVKASAGNLYGVQAFNTNAAARFLKIYDKASAPTVGTDTPIATWMIPATGGFVLSFPNPISFTSGLAFAITGAIADSDTTAIGLNDVAVNLQIK